jgi:hypothetical protein
MQATWTFSNSDVVAVQVLVAQYAKAPLVVSRKASISVPVQACSKADFWDKLVAAVLSSQQQWHKVAAFLATSPLPLPAAQGNNFQVVAQSALAAGGQRFPERWGKALAKNVAWLDQQDAQGNDGWNEMSQHAGQLVTVWGAPAPAAITAERAAARWASSRLRGVGPKQSRNLWQMLGLSRFDIPLDSRVMSWLNDLGSSPKLSATALADRHFYEWVLDGVQDLCSQAGVLPCIFDAAVFVHLG